MTFTTPLRRLTRTALGTLSAAALLASCAQQGGMAAKEAPAKQASEKQAMSKQGPMDATHAGKLNPNDPNDAIRIDQKLNCSLKQGDVVVYWWKGGAFSRVPGERDRHLFDVEGMNIRQCQNVQDDKRGYGFRSVSREILLYKDAETGQILRTWKNPWTGKEVEVIHVANNPVNMRRPMFAMSADGKPHKADIRIIGNRAWSSGEAPLFYKNPLAGEYQEFIGNDYHAMEALNGYVYTDDLLDATKPKLSSYTLSWARFSEWLPWMQMGSRTGMMIFSTVGGRVDSFKDLPDSIRKEIEANYPIYNAPPPVNDDRPNETSWTYMKKVIDAKRAAAPKTNAKAGE
ncbi:MAG: DUF1838 domain-containing protein [Rhodospirillaceae bacterium]|nr:DUF1838 domain-containing protein [Rhodospirillaceae bacterium]